MTSDKNGTDATIKRLSSFWKYICKSLCKIHLVDKCLLMLMLVLMAQSTYILLTNGGNSPVVNHIDIIVRTASASIFGYFLSANFVQRQIKPKSNTVTADQANAQTHEEQPPPDEEKPSEISHLQIVTATAIAVFCLLSLIFVRDFSGYGETQNAATTAVVSQFRDFVSGCVGFLIGCPTPKAGGK